MFRSNRSTHRDTHAGEPYNCDGAPARRVGTLAPRSFWTAAATTLTALFVLAATALAPGAARAQSGATTYSTTQRVFKVGVLLVDSTDTGDGHGDENPDPYIFYIADQRTDLKPQGWSFVNPLAPATVTSNIKSRWDARMGGNNASGYQIGQKVLQNMAAYWEVSLTNTSISQLSQFDMLWITNHRTTAFTPADREKLRKVVDAGGVLWMEDCGGMQIGHANTANGTLIGPFFLDGVQFEGGTFGNFTTNRSGCLSAAASDPDIAVPAQHFRNRESRR